MLVKNKKKHGETLLHQVYVIGSMKYSFVAFINFVTLATGIAIGLIIAPRVEKTVRAKVEGVQSAPSSTPTVPNEGTQVAAGAPKVTPITPMMTGGSIGVYLVLAHHVQSDELVVNGYDMLKLQQGELNLLSRFVPPAEISKIVDNAKATEIYTVKTPASTQPVKPTSK